MPTRAFLLSALVTLTLSACSLFDREGDGGVDPADSTAVATLTTDSTAPVVAATPVTDSLAGSATGTPTQVADTTAPNVSGQAGIDARIELLLLSQAALSRQVDSLATMLATGAGAPPADVQTDSAGIAEASTEVLGQAGRSVQGFGLRVVWSVIVLVLFSFVIRGLVWVLDALAERNAARRLFYKRVVPIVRIVLWIFAAYLIVSVIFQIDRDGLLAASAAVGVAVGFAAQDMLKNLFGGIIVVFDQPFQVGDKISVGGTYGEVVSIGLRSTRIVTPDDNLVSVPNAQVADQQVANANAGELNCQVVTDLFLPGWADEQLAKRIAFDAAASSKYVFLNKPIVTLVSDVFKETFLTRIRVKAYVLDPRLEFLFQSDVTERAREGFRAAGLLRPENIRLGLVARSSVGVSARDAEDESLEARDADD